MYQTLLVAHPRAAALQQLWQRCMSLRCLTAGMMSVYGCLPGLSCSCAPWPVMHVFMSSVYVGLRAGLHRCVQLDVLIQRVHLLQLVYVLPCIMSLECGSWTHMISEQM